MEKADKQQHDRVIFDGITGAIYGPNSNGATEYVARAVAPEVSYQIGQYFKGTNSEGSAPHILAHGILAAAVSAATGNDVTTGALSAMGAEAAAPMVAKFLFGDKPISELSADEKATVSSITSLGGLGVGASTGDVGSAVSAGEAGKVAVEDNAFYDENPIEAEEIRNNPNYAREQLEAIKANKKYILIGIDFIPVIGDIKGFYEAESVGDYIFASAALVPLLGDGAKAAYMSAKASGNLQAMKNALQNAINNLQSRGLATQTSGANIIQMANNGQDLKPVVPLPTPKTATQTRNSPGKSFSSTSLKELKVGESLFKGANSAPVPKQVADKLSGRSFNTFDDFRKAFWIEMANDPAVARNFKSDNLSLMKQGKAPYAPQSQHNGGNKKYELDHNIEIRDGGAVYNLDNIIIRTPKDHVQKTGNRGR